MTTSTVWCPGLNTGTFTHSCFFGANVSKVKKANTLSIFTKNSLALVVHNEVAGNTASLPRSADYFESAIPPTTGLEELCCGMSFTKEVGNRHALV